MRFLLTCALAGALLALPAAASASPDPVTVSKGVTVKSSGVSSVTLACPAKAIALSGYVTSLSPGAIARDSSPTDIRRWSFDFSSAGGTESARVGLRCLGLKLPRSIRKVRRQIFTIRMAGRVAGNSSRTLRVSCSGGFLPTGYGLDRSGAGGSAQRLLLASAVPGARGWSFRVKNTASGELPVTARLRCMSARATGKRGGRTLSERFAIRRASFSDTVGSGAISHRCGAGTLSLAAGHVVPLRDDITMSLHHPAGTRSGAWELRNRTGAAKRVRTYLTCLSLRTRFR